MYYEYETFNNYQELAAKHPDAAAEALNEFGEGEWQGRNLHWYPTKEDFAMHELEEGQYSDFGLSRYTDFNGAPNLLDFINFNLLGEALVENWYNTSNFEADNGEIVTTEIGW